MTFQNLIITQKSKLSFANNCLVILQGEGNEIRVPLLNINIILLDSPQIMVSSVLMREVVQNGVVIISCDDKHLPNGIMLGFNTHFQVSRVLKMQIGMSAPLKKQIWKKIVQNKILSQGLNLKYIGSEKYLDFIHYSNEVQSGDYSNMEAVCAKIYFSEIFENFRRFDDDKTNIMLNYGYSLIRSTIAKHLVISGLNPALGIFHHNQFNNFNLADDIIELFRWLVDRKVWECKTKDGDFTKEDRVYLFQIFEEKVQFEDGKYDLINAIEKVVQSFARVVKTKDIKEFEMPKI